MKPNNDHQSEERIKKATELLQKFWWFSWFIIIAPLTITFIGFLIFSLFRAPLFIALSLCVITFMFALLFFYKAYDKYRENPFFLNKKNNLNARIHVLFLISILSFIVTPIFILISPIGLSFTLLPLISYATLYNIVYYYYHFQPIDFFNLTEEEFKHTVSVELKVKQPYNFIIVVNYVIHIIFLAVTASTNFSWLYALVTNLLFYLITLTSTKKLINKIKDSIIKKKAFLKELTLFKQRYTVSLVNLFFVILIQMPFVIIITFSLSGTQYSSLELLNNSFLTVIFILFYFKSRFYINSHYTSKINLYEDPEKLENLKEKVQLPYNKYQKYNSYLSGILILLIILFSFFSGNPTLILIILPFLFILFQYEQKTELCPKKYNRFVFLLNSIAILISISFGVIPSVLESILINFLVFCLSLYFVLQIFVKFKYFIKENILIFQNLLAVASFSFLIYLFFPIIVIEYTIFTSDLFIILISNFLIHLILFLVILLVSFYVLYARVFYDKRTKLFRISVIINILLIETVLFILINLRIFFLVDIFTFFQVLVLTTILFPTIFILFVGINFLLGILPKRDLLVITYYSIWTLIATIFLSIFINNINNYIIIVLDLLILSIFLHYNLKFGLKLDKLTTSAFEKFVKINSYILTFELFFLFYTIFFAVFQFLLLIDNIIYSAYLSLAIECVLINLLSKKEIFSETFYIKINVFILAYSSIIAFYFFLMLTLYTLYAFVIPLMASSILIYLPILYLRKKKIYPKLTSKSILINNGLISITISLIPTITGLELFYLGFYFNLVFLIMTVINCTLFILLILFTIYYHVSKKVNRSEKRVRFFLKSQVLILICISITTLFYYPLFLFINTLYYIVLPLIFTSCFLCIPLFYSYKKEIFKLENLKRVIFTNMVFLTGLFTSIPTLIGINLLNLGFLIDVNLFVLNLINSSIYAFCAFLLILIGVSEKLKLKDKLILILNRLKVIILFGVSITTVFCYPFFLLLNTIYYIVLPLIFTSCFLYILLLYSYKSGIFNIERIKKAALLNTMILTGLFTSIPVLVGINLLNLGFTFDVGLFVLNLINFSLFIFYAFLLILTNLSKKLEIKENFVHLLNRLQIITLLSISITTVFCYPFLLLLNTLYYIILPLIFTSCFLYILLFYLYKIGIFNIERTKKAALLNTMILTGLFTSIPVLVGIDLLNLGFVFDIGLFVLNLINFTSIIFYAFLLILTSLSKKLEIKEKFIHLLNQLQIITLLSISITIVFCYPFLLLLETFYGIIIPLIALLCSWFFLFYYSYKREYFNLERVKKLTIYNFIALSCLIISLPTIISLELTKVGLRPNIILIITTSIFLLFSFLKITELISAKIKLKATYVRLFKLSQIISWFLFTILLSYYIVTIFIVRVELNPFTFLIISCSLFIFFILSMYTLKLSSDYLPDLSILNYIHDIIVYGIILSVSFIFTFLNLSTNLFAFIFPELVLNISMLICFFFTIFILFLIICDNLIKLKFTQTKIILELAAWLTIKTIICIIMVSLLELYVYHFFIINKIFLFSLFFIILTPLSLHILKNFKFISSKNQFLLKRITLIIFIISILSIYFEFFYNLTIIIPFFYQNLLFQRTIIAANLFLFLYYYILRFNKIIDERSVFTLYKLYLLSVILFVSLLYFNSILSIFLLLISYIIILSKRSIIPTFRFLSYILLSYVTFVEILAILSLYGIIVGFDIVLINIFIIVYLLSMNGVLFFSILLNRKKSNNLEKFTLYFLISLLSFVSLMTYILFIYNITISLFIFLLFIGIFFYRQKDERYKWFIKPCVILAIFDIVSFMSYSWLFNNQIFGLYNGILTFTLTLSMTGFGFVLLYNDAPARFRNKFFYTVLVSIIFSFPTFLYFLIIASLSLPLVSLIPLIVAVDFGVFLFYLSIGIYQWRISWVIWKSGLYIWNIVPIANFFLIYPSLTGIDVATNALNLFGTDINGSVIVSLIICVLIWLPFWYTWIKKHFARIIFIVWGLNLFLLYWVSQNLFITDLLLTNLSFGLFSVTLLMLLLAIFKYWKIVSIFWVLISTPINTIFLGFYLISIGISLEITISIDILVIGLFLIVYSFFPNIRSVGVVLISAYFITLLGIFLTIFFILYSIILNPIFSINISFIIIGFTLFSSKYTKLPKRIIDSCLSLILISNFSCLTFITFNLFPGLMILAFSLALTVAGFSFFILNRYKMKFRINKIIPNLTLAVGVSLSVTSLISIILKASPGILISTFSSVFIVFLYFIFTEYRFILWFVIPIPITTPILELLLRVEFIQPFWFLTWAMLYLTSFQILINLFKNYVKDETSEIKNSLMKLYQDKNQIKWLNLTCFLFNSICTSLFISIILPNLLKLFLFTQILWIYQICDFLIIWSFLFLFCMKYIEKSDLDIKIKDPLRYFNKISFVLYLLIPIAIGINLFLYMIYINAEFVISLYLLLLVVSGIIFIEGYIIDRHIFYLLFNSTRNKFILYAWVMLCNTFALFLYLFHLNFFFLVLTISFLNLISLHFLSFLDISKQKISAARLILIYNSLIWGSFFIASLISDGLLLLIEELRGFTYYSLLFQNSFLLLFILSYFFVEIKYRAKNWIEFILLILFQGLFAINLFQIFTIFGILNFLLINFIILIEICLSFKSVQYLNTIVVKQKYPNFLPKMYSFLVLVLYFELSFMVYGLISEFIGIFGSIIVSLSVLFILTLLDIYSIKKVKRSYASLVHTISFFIISLVILLNLHNLVVQYPILISLEIFVFIIMQFYTNYSLFASLKDFKPNKKDTLKKIQIQIQHLLGIGFYTTLSIFIFQTLLLQGFEIQLILLILSILIHLLMIIDSYLLKFIGKSSSYIKVISWIFIITFTSTYLVWLYSVYFVAFFFSVIPIIVLILIIEIAYLFKLLSFWQFIVSKKEKIRHYLIILTYLNFVSWPLYFASLNPIIILNLGIASILIMLLITYIDDNLGALKENLRKSVRTYSFLIFGGLLSIDTFILLDFIPNFDIFLNLSISSLIFIFFLTIKVRPFKEHSAIAAIFWFIIFLLLSLIVYFASFNLIAFFIVLGLTCLVYPFIFLLEELKELFNNLIDYLATFFRYLNRLIKITFIKIINFLKTHYKSLWILFSIFISIFMGTLLSPVMLNFLHPIHSTLLVFPVFGILYSVMPSKISEDVDVMFRRRMIRLIIIWGSIIVVLFTFITLVWYIFTIWISIWIVDAILLPYIRFKEKNENISIRWRFYTLVISIILLILFGIIVIIQIYINFFL